jgi:hypothetical protein
MNLDEALSKDMELKTRFLGAIAGKQQLDVAAISKADSCGLGNWLYGEGERKYKFLKSYKQCIDAHAAFHTLAGKVVRQINLGEYADAEATLAQNTAYSKAFDALDASVKALKKDAKL